MGTKFIQRGEVMTYVAPAGGVTVNVPLLIGSLLVIPRNTAAAGALVDVDTTGVFSVTKADSQAWTIGAKIYWDDTAKNFTTTATANTLVGSAAEAVASTAGLTTGKVRLNGTV
jgi:predicted RecA/RadA family phage recombinase